MADGFLHAPDHGRTLNFCIADENQKLVLIDSMDVERIKYAGRITEHAGIARADSKKRFAHAV